MKNVTLIGLGGVGGHFGYKLLKAKNEKSGVVYNFVARGETYREVKEKGLTLLSPGMETRPIHPDGLFEELRSIPPTDLFIICVKEYDLEGVCRQLEPLIHRNTILLPLMNGVDIYERMRKIIKEGTILPACVYVASHIKTPGLIEHKGLPGRVFVGQDPNRHTPVPGWIVDLFTNSGIEASFLNDATPIIWMKFLFIAPFGLITARYNVSIGKVLQDQELRNQACDIMNEIVAIAKKKNIPMGKDAIDETFEKASGFPTDATTSLQLDIRQGKPKNELELFAGAILNYGKELDVDVEATRSVYLELKQMIQG